jgi:hypothetical protein
MTKTTNEKLSLWLGPERWLTRIGLATAAALSLATAGVLAGWRDVLSSLLLPKLPPQLLLDTVWLLLSGLLLMALSWWFYRLSVRHKIVRLRQRTKGKYDTVRIHSGVEFRHGPTTGNVWIPYCPKCHTPLNPDSYASRGFGCHANCGWSSPISSNEIWTIANEEENQ